MVNGHRAVFTTGDVARICNVAPRTVSKWFDSGRLKGYRIPGSQDRRIPRSHLIEFLKLNGMPLGDLEQVGINMLVIGTGRMAKLADRMVVCAGKEMSIQRCDTLFQAGLKMGSEQFHVLVVDGAVNGLQETVQFIRTLVDQIVILAVREAGGKSVVEGIDDYFTSDESPEPILMRATQLVSKRMGLASR